MGDPEQTTQQLNDQLRQLGLYAADTVGDGNCLFRALSDQFYGSDAHHLQLREDICDWIEENKMRYEPFVEDDRGIDAHLRLMRSAATYGGHLELSAFAHMARRDVKVIQPGLVYVIEWASGWDTSQIGNTPWISSNPFASLKREQGTMDAEEPMADASDEHVGPVYVAYHDWEHFSSIRNLRGPHEGRPVVKELDADDVEMEDLPPPPPKRKGKQAAKAAAPAAPKPAPKTTKKAAPKKAAPKKAAKKKDTKSSVPAPAPAPSPPPPPPISAPLSPLAPLTPLSSPSTAPPTPLTPLSPADIPLPLSRSPSPLTLAPPATDRRSPKRTFDESSASSNDSGIAKRSRPNDQVDVSSVEEDDDTPALSDISTAPSSPSPSPPTPAPDSVTKRQRKALGLPKPRPAVTGQRSAGKITIPGGRFRKPAAPAKPVVMDDDDGEWARNGVGRVDVRGFRELRI
ncbi:hypothetical protein OF83DRAFT_1165358 [Amylostereum chailletii]|nr:hypothetical protein OF83DRAFT_1165358 [Amylostereum chailletii]